MRRLDDAIHDLYFEINCEDGGINWNESALGCFSWYYAEKSLYMVRHNDSGGLHLVKAHNPIDAMMKVANEISIKHNE